MPFISIKVARDYAKDEQVGAPIVSTIDSSNHDRDTFDFAQDGRIQFFALGNTQRSR